MISVYIITNTLNDKMYVGQSTSPEYRWKQHIYAADRPVLDGMYVHKAMGKYGVSNFKFEIIRTFETSSEADWVEAALIRHLDTRESEKGYNIAVGGSGGPMFGRRASAETLARMRAAKLGKRHSRTARKNMSAAAMGNTRRLGMTHTPKTIEKIRKSNLGQKRSKTAIENNRRARLGAKQTPETVALRVAGHATAIARRYATVGALTAFYLLRQESVNASME